MITLLPPSEGKEFNCNTEGTKPLDLGNLVFGDRLNTARENVLDSLIHLGADAAALDVLGVSEKLKTEVQTHQHLRKLPTCPAAQVYSGVIFEAAQIKDWESTPHIETTYITSALYGLVGITDLIRPYRMSMNVKLPGIGALKTYWRKNLAGVFQELAHDQMILDLRSGTYQSVWAPNEKNAAAADCRFITVRVVRRRDGKEKVISHFAKHWRGILLHRLASNNYVIETPQQCLEITQSFKHSDSVPIADARLEKKSERVFEITLILE